MFINYPSTNDALKNFVKSFSISTKQQCFPVKYTAFPNVGNCLSFFDQTAITITSEKIKFEKDPIESPTIVLLGQLQKPTAVNYEEYVEEITINFTPFSINYFFDVPFSKIAEKCHQILVDSKWTAFASKLFSELPERRIAMLEEFLLSSFENKKDSIVERMHKSIAAIDELSVSDLANIACMSERNFSRNFKKYLGCTPSTYKRILRFRNTISKQYSKRTNSYNKLLLADNYYDVSHFRKEFKGFTGYTPEKFNKESFFKGNGDAIFKLD